MGVFRSEEILHLKLRMPGDIESSVRIMDAFGKIEQDAIEFIDLTKDDIEAKKNFQPMIKRCEEMENKISNFIKCSNDFNQKYFSYSSYIHFIKDLENDQMSRDLSFGSYFDVVESEIIDNEKKIIDLIDAYQKIKEDLVIEIEKKCVYEKFYSITSSLNFNQVSSGSNNSSGIVHNSSLLNIMGIINATDDIKMNRMVLRCSRGRAMTTFFDFVYPSDLAFDFTKNKKIVKKIFIIFYPSEGREVLKKKLLQICDVLSASRYSPPEEAERQMVIDNLASTIKEKKDYLIQAEGSIRNFLREVSGTEVKPGKLDLYRLFFKKEKMIYTNLNKCLLRENFIDGEVWVIAKHKEMLVNILNTGYAKDDTKTQGTFIEIYNDERIDRPTYIPTNEFLYPFQQIVNTYGIPRYQEINPAYFNIVTFPFLFGIMFGDIGHGLLIFLFSLYLCAYHEDFKKQKQKSFFKMLSKYRYFFLLLSISSIFCGLIYNDFLSVPLPLFGTCYVNKSTEAVREDKQCIYPFGIDPKWYIADNELAFLNSLKMKFSVIFGVIHMLFGIILKGANDFHFGNWVAFIFEFVPELIFMGLMFGYMIIMILIKWTTDWDGRLEQAPSLISQLINIVIKKGSVNDLPLWGTVKEQEGFHLFILIVCVLLIPLMLLPKPIIDYYRYRRKKERNENHLEEGINNSGIESNVIGNDNYIHVSQVKINEELLDKNFLDFFINQAIAIIEFILGTVSNTASYLRLWALSLAHVELTKVFFEKTLQDQIIEGDYYFGLGFLSIFVGYFVWANVTFFVLICMDFMECFLHTLRLHWVEFQNKFFKADGYLFVPYSFKYIIESDEGDF